MNGLTTIAALPATGGAGSALKAEEVEERAKPAFRGIGGLVIDNYALGGQIKWTSGEHHGATLEIGPTVAIEPPKHSVTVNISCNHLVDGKTAAQIAAQLRSSAPRRVYKEPCRATFLDVTDLADDKQRLVKIQEPASPEAWMRQLGMEPDGTFRKDANGKWEMEC